MSIRVGVSGYVKDPLPVVKALGIVSQSEGCIVPGGGGQDRIE